MVSIAALMNVLPNFGLEPQVLAFVDINSNSSLTIWLLEPPAGQRTPFVEVGKTLRILFLQHGATTEQASHDARLCVARMTQDTITDNAVYFFDDLNPDSPPCLSLQAVLDWLESHAAFLAEQTVNIDPDLVAFLRKANDVTIQTRVFMTYGDPEPGMPWSLQTLPFPPPPKAMTEFVPGEPWSNFDDDDWKQNADHPFLQWREAMLPVAQSLERTLGAPVYSFMDLDDEFGDDYAHRFFVLHWCCHWKPESTYVRFLLKASGAQDVEELKHVLLQAESFAAFPFKLNASFGGSFETLPCRFHYRPPAEMPTLTVVFRTLEAREVACKLLQQNIGANAVIVAPKDLQDEAWVQDATRYCSEDVILWYVDDSLFDYDPFELLARTDVLKVIANAPTSHKGCDLQLSEDVEDLLWLALKHGIPSMYFMVSGNQLLNPEDCLAKGGAPEREKHRLAQRKKLTREMSEIRLDNDFGSSGLWDARGRNLGYDILDLPFALIKRIHAWQQSFEENAWPNNWNKGENWREQHDQQMLVLARELQDTLDSSTVVQIHRDGAWHPIREITV